MEKQTLEGEETEEVTADAKRIQELLDCDAAEDARSGVLHEDQEVQIGFALGVGVSVDHRAEAEKRWAPIPEPPTVIVIPPHDDHPPEEQKWFVDSKNRHFKADRYGHKIIKGSKRPEWVDPRD